MQSIKLAILITYLPPDIKLTTHRDALSVQPVPSNLTGCKFDKASLCECELNLWLIHWHSPHLALQCIASALIWWHHQPWYTSYGKLQNIIWGQSGSQRLRLGPVSPVVWMMYGLLAAGDKKKVWLVVEVLSSPVKTLLTINLGSVGSDCQWHIVILLPALLKYISQDIPIIQVKVVEKIGVLWRLNSTLGEQYSY